MNVKEKLGTKNENTWCPGCTNFMLLEAVKKTLARLIESGKKQEEFAIATGIGCHAKIFDYLNVSGVYGLHGRVIPIATGIKLGNPNLTVIGFEGDGDAYAEGMEHFIHAGRQNPNITLLVHDNRTFALTTGQATPTSQLGFKSKAEPQGDQNNPINPMKLALASGISFIARAYTNDIQHTSEIIEKAIKHKGFSFVEILQTCIQFNREDFSKSVYKIPDNKDLKKAEQLVNEWDYNSQGKIPIGILYQAEKPTFEEKLKIRQ